MLKLIKIIISVEIFLAIALPAQAEDKNAWTATDTALQATYTVLHVMDWSQTLHIARNHVHCYPNGTGIACALDYEDNSLLGEHPSIGLVNSYFASTLVLHTAVSYILPKPYRTIWQAITIGIEYGTVQHNRRTGIGVNLHF